MESQHLLHLSEEKYTTPYSTLGYALDYVKQEAVATSSTVRLINDAGAYLWFCLVDYVANRETRGYKYAKRHL